MKVKKYNQFIDPQSLRVMIGDNFLDLEVCRNHIKGLSGRSKVSLDGMIFMFESEMPLSFHMENCKISLDIIFCSKGSVSKIYHNCPPCITESCKKYSHPSSDLVIELPGNTCKLMGIQEGIICQVI